jgi:hypothetical protein
MAGVVVVDGERRQSVRSERVAEMIRYLVTNQVTVGQIVKGSLAFNFAGEKRLIADLYSKEIIRAG